MRGYDVGPETVNWEMQSRFEEFCSAAFGPNVINQNWMMRLYTSFASWKFQQPQGCSSRAESCSTALAL